MGPRQRRWVAVIGALAILAAAAGGTAPARASAFRVTVSRATRGRPIAGNFLGLALEYNTIPKLAGAAPGSTDPVFAQLLHNLDPTSRPIIRVGGQSTDRTWWPVRGMARPLGVTYSLWPGWTAAARTLAAATGARYLLGINLEANRTRISGHEGSQLVAGVGRANIAALEIGNEPDLYPLVPWYKVQGGKPIAWYNRTGRPVYSRRSTYGPAQFAQEFSRTVKVLPRLPVAGPETGAGPWMQAFDAFVSPRSQVRMLTSHDYGLNQCVTNPASRQYPSVPNLLRIVNSRGGVSLLPPDIAFIHRNRGTFRIDEMGSISCNGRRGVSNTMASALWLMDSLFDIAAQGIDGVNLHDYPHSANGLFDFARSHGRWVGTVHPLYYGALMFAQAAPAGSRLLRIATPAQTTVRAWATLGPDHRIRVLLINDSLHSRVAAQVRAGSGGGTAAVQRLRAPSAYATGGIALGGRSFGPQTTTGQLPAPRAVAVSARAGTYSVSLPAASAALLTLPLRAR